MDFSSLPYQTQINKCKSFPQNMPRGDTVTNYCGLLRVNRTRTEFGVYSVMKRFFLPTVHAQEMTVTADSSDTSISRMENARPKIVISEKDVMDYVAQESGIQRLKGIFTKTEGDEYSDDLSVILQTMRNCSAIVFLVTSVLGGNAAREKFIEKNKHKTYETRFQAFRKYNDAVFFGSLRLGTKWALKAAFFTAFFMTTAQSISVYRNKSSVFEYIVAGSVTCGILRLNMGLRGMFAGAVIGGGMGLIGGGCLCALMYSSNASQQQRHYWSVEKLLREKREAELLKGKTAAGTSLEGQAA